MNIEQIMLIILGFLFASLIALLLGPAFWKRAVRLTTERISASTPITAAEMQADKDQLRADFAIKIRQFEIELDQAKLKTARQLIELSRKDTEISKFKNKLQTVSTELEEQKNANEVMRQTILTRVPQMEIQLQKAKEMLGERYQEITKLKSTIVQREGELGEAKSLEQMRQSEMKKLKSTLNQTKLGFAADDKTSHIKEIENLTDKNRVLEGEIDQLKDDLKLANQKLDTENSNLKREMHKLTQNILELSDKNSDQPSDNENIESPKEPMTLVDRLQKTN